MRYPKHPGLQQLPAVKDDSANANQFVYKPNPEILAINDQHTRLAAIQTKFNEHWTKNQGKAKGWTFMSEATVRKGTRLLGGQVWITSENFIPYMTIADNKFWNLPAVSGFTDYEDLEKFNYNDPIYGGDGVYVLNIPGGYYLKAWTNNQPILLEAGCHIIHDSTFQLEVTHNKSQNTTTKVEGRELTTLISKKAPVLNANLVNVNQDYITHGNIHIIRVKPGKFAKVCINGQYALLPHRNDPYIFKKNLFEWGNFVDSAQHYIRHNTIHYIQVPQGKIALPWFGSQSDLMPPRDEPYIYDDPNFQLQAAKEFDASNPDSQFFHDATEKVIRHGSILRLIPDDGEVAVTFQNGLLKVYSPTENEPIIVDNPGIRFEAWCSTKIRNRLLPSNPAQQADERARYIHAITAEGLELGLKVFVQYQIERPDITLKNALALTEVDKHVEMRVCTVVTQAIREMNSATFLKSDVVSIRSKVQPEQSSAPAQAEFGKPSAPPKENDIGNKLDELQRKLHDEFATIGIHLHLINIEQYTVLDEKVRAEMSAMAIGTMKLNNQGSQLDQRVFNQSREQHIQQQDFTLKLNQAQLQRQAELAQMKLEAEIFSSNPAFAMVCMVRAAAQGQNPTALPMMAQMWPMMMTNAMPIMPNIVASQSPASVMFPVAPRDNPAVVAQSDSTNTAGKQLVLE